MSLGRTEHSILLLAAAMVASVQGLPLCVHGHPARRQPHVTYGGKPPREGYQRDHYVSLGLGGLDVSANVRYQRCDKTGLYGRCEAGPAALKDKDEHKAEERMCSSRWHWSQTYAQQWLTKRWPIDAAHGYDTQ